MKLSSPLPQPLPKECVKAAKIFKSFVDSGNNGLDGIIPRQVLQQAKGFAIFTVIKAGFLFSARAGSGIVIARLEDDSWSAPSAIGSAGLGVGGQAGAEMTDFLVVLNSQSAVRSFMSAGSLTLGGNMSIALGPLGRNGEALGSLNTSGKLAAMYSYSKTRGLFGGVSVEGSVIVERQDANAQAYQSDVSAKQLLSGTIPPPDWAQPLIKTLEACVGLPGRQKWIDDSADISPGPRGSGYAFGGGVTSPGTELPSSLRKKTPVSSPFPPPSWGRRKSGGSYFTSNSQNDDFGTDYFPSTGTDARSRSTSMTENKLVDVDSGTSDFGTKFESDFVPPSSTGDNGHRHALSVSSRNPNFSDPSSTFGGSQYPSASGSSNPFTHNRSFSDGTYLSAANNRHLGLPATSNLPSKSFPSQERDPFAYESNGETIDDYEIDHERSVSLLRNKPLSPSLGSDGVAIALYDFNAVQHGDLAFKKGQVIKILKKTDKTDDWWTGELDGKSGIFPANFVEVA